MSLYSAPLRDVMFSLAELNGFAEHYENLGDHEFTLPDLEEILPEVARFSREVLARINKVGDSIGATLEEGEVNTPPGFKAAFDQYVEGGWPRLSHAEEIGGIPSPYSAKVVLAEFLQAANQSWCMYTSLNDGAIKTLTRCASPALVEKLVPKLVSGEWLGTMCLTEPQCGSDLSLLSTKAEATEFGTYRVTGTKIFISSGDQDLTENIIHLVLAKLPGAPQGTRGVSLFAVPKWLIDQDGNIGEKNAVSCVSLESKMGLKGSATCVLAFDGAEGWIVGEENRGLQNMFLFINKSRLGAAQQAQAQIDASHQVALEYAHERKQGRAPGQVDIGQAADSLVLHPEIQRMLMSQKAISEGGRSLIHACAKWVDLSDSGSIEKSAEAESRLAFLIPIAKGFLTELASEMTDNSIQILGGHGYTKDWDLEQRFRDVRVTRIYEGTTYIQAIDLLERKMLGGGSKAVEDFLSFISGLADEVESEALAPYKVKVQEGIQQWSNLVLSLTRNKVTSRHLAEIAFDHLMFSGYITLASIWLKSASVAEAALVRGEGDLDFYRAKMATATFYFNKILPRISTHYALILSAGDEIDSAIALKK